MHTPVTFDMPLLGRTRPMKGRVVRVQEREDGTDPGMAVVFVDLSDMMQSALKQLITAIQAG